MEEVELKSLVDTLYEQWSKEHDREYVLYVYSIESLEAFDKAIKEEANNI